MYRSDLVCDLDFETRCDRDIDDGLAQYFASPHFSIMCAAWAIGDEPPQIWVPGQMVPPRLFEHIWNGGRVAAHNAPFEQGVCSTDFAADAGWPELLDEQLECVMAQCLQHNLPAGLDDAATALGLEFRKYELGRKIMLKWCKPKPNKKGILEWQPFDAQEALHLYQYNLGDVDQERAVRLSLFPMPEVERKFWCLDQRINRRGVQVSPLELEAASRILEEAESAASAEIVQLTKGEVKGVNCNAALAKFCGLPGAAKDDIEVGLAVTTDPVRRRVMEIRQESGLASVKKIKALNRWRSEDFRVRGMYQYHGAGTTGRDAGRGPQPTNMPRPVELEQADIDQFFEALPWLSAQETWLWFGNPMRALSDSVRGFFKAPPGKKYVQVDFSSIEGITLAWVAGEEWVLEVYRTHGKMYETTAAKVLGISLSAVTKALRQLGKVFELAFGYQGGTNALDNACDTYKQPRFPDEQKPAIRDAWRSSRPRTVRLWADIEQCAMAAVAHPGHEARLRMPYTDIIYRVENAPGGMPFLFCRLPSGRNIAYPRPAIEMVETPWGQVKPQVTYLRRHPQRKHQFVRENLYGGKLTENWVQACARDPQRDQMFRFDEEGWPIVHHCYDEVLNEVPDTDEWTVERAQEIAAILPAWAKGMPIKAGGWEGPRYKKD